MSVLFNITLLLVAVQPNLLPIAGIETNSGKSSWAELYRAALKIPPSKMVLAFFTKALISDLLAAVISMQSIQKVCSSLPSRNIIAETPGACDGRLRSL